jgi:hypothetical protein
MSRDVKNELLRYVRALHLLAISFVFVVSGVQAALAFHVWQSGNQATYWIGWNSAGMTVMLWAFGAFQYWLFFGRRGAAHRVSEAKTGSIQH